ncbi:MAG: ABC transporter ATP-binding protein [Treponemataceae bacterium]|nr:MAG: ABC transporter ATP-binding protein [Treponemataceae bacterium]
MNNVLVIEKLEKTFITGNDRLTIIKDLDLIVEEGSQIAVTGESGCGKSTLLNIIAGLDYPTAGKITVGGYEITSFRESGAAAEDRLTEYRARFLGLIFQFHYLLQDFTALENVYLPAYMTGAKKNEAVKRAKELLDAVGLSRRMSHMPSELSGGERQRVSVARSLINNPRLILADEPTGNLDPANAAMIGGLLFSLAANYNKTLILVTHDKDLASKAKTLYRLKDGRLHG